MTEQPYGIGTACFPMPLSNGAPLPPPRTIAKNKGYGPLLGFPILNGVWPAPVSIGPGYLQKGTCTFQAMIDDYMSGGPGFSLTNAVVVELK